MTKSVLPKFLLVLVVLLSIITLLAACDSNNTPTPAQATNGDPGSSTQTDIESALATATVLAGSIPSGDSSDFAPAGIDLTGLDPCTLLTADEITALMGDVPVAPSPMSRNEGHVACSYVEPTLEVDSPRLFLSVETTEFWQLYGNGDPVTGIGDEANTLDFNGWQTLRVLVKDKAIISVDIFPKNTDTAKQLVQKAIDRLP